ncbi:hypothetical protein BE04_37710 [Sorangium cellulosum]|uniref:Uncharacterized protein n=1 Tax=Sorangium cellulosum TaxID=56 RepID=A0A150P1G8_SORCE|nr:hypothetical protein BE04_37710 [Sorangium cellulosum]
MSYELLLGLYFGESSNADLTSSDARRLLHVRTPLEDYVAQTLRRGLDVVLTGNPGDGKSHVAHVLRATGDLEDAEVHPDLSAGPSAVAIERWLGARRAGRRFVLLGNEGPLVEFIAALQGTGPLKAEASELHGQLRRLLVQQRSELPPEPQRVALVDLADRSVLDAAVVEAMLERVSSDEFLPNFSRAVDSSVGRNLVALQTTEVRARLARVLCAAGRRRGEHVTFRQLWSAIAFAVTGAKAVATLKQELSMDAVGLGTTPMDYLTSPRGRGLLLEAARTFGDPAAVPDPDLDEQLWSTGQPSGGEWFGDELHAEPPATLWAQGQRAEALRAFAQTKRAVALLHTRGDRLIHGIERRLRLPRDVSDDALRREIVRGLRHLYVSPMEEAGAPRWLLDGVPLWIGFSYADRPAEERPHVAVRALGEAEFQVLRPQRAPWLEKVLGPPPDLVWLVHRESGVSLRVDAEMLGALAAASGSSGPMPVPEPIQRFLVRLAGWDESSDDLEPREYPCAVLERPRGKLEVSARVERVGEAGARYV